MRVNVTPHPPRSTPSVTDHTDVYRVHGRFTMVGGKLSLVWFLALLCALVKVTESGECCRSHYDVMGNVMNERWCANYCCLQGNIYSCCNNWFFRAPAHDRSTFCVNWFTRHIWVPIIVALIILGLLIGCGVCCCCMCC